MFAVSKMLKTEFLISISGICVTLRLPRRELFFGAGYPDELVEIGLEGRYTSGSCSIVSLSGSFS